jgi:uncharacterized membrane protein YvlD (DUF360 family)
MSIKDSVVFVVRFAVLWFVDTASIVFAAWLLPSVNLAPGPGGGVWIPAASAAFALGIINLLIRPLILLLALPLGFFVIFAVGFFINAFAIFIASALLPAFQVQGLGAAFLAALIMAGVNTVITGLTTIDDDDSFFQGLVERLAARNKFQSADMATRGLVMLEIDGLSYWHMKRALEEGYMPDTKRLMEEHGATLTRVDCGLPSQTSACQAGILFGDNYDIPAFRWYDKAQKKTYVSGKDAPEINARYARGNGLLRGGSSINNMMNGDAEKSLLTLADLRAGSPEEKKRRANDIYLLMVNPYFITRTIVLVLADAAREVWQYLGDKVNKVEPRLNRLSHGYPFVRAATTVFMRDVAEYLVTLDIVRGAPAIYATWPGYDEVAHHTGPSTRAAMDTLRQYDRTIGRIADVIRRKGGRRYDLIVLSDHGQSFGATFKQRYGLNLKGFIEQHLPAGSQVTLATGGDDGSIAMAAVAGELENLSDHSGGRIGKAAADAGVKAINAGIERRADDNKDGAAGTKVTVFGSGNLAPVYFHFSENRVTRRELAAIYPGLFDALLMHEGVGAILAYEADGAPVVWGKEGRRNLRTGELQGDDPLGMYGDPEVRARQLSRLADFPNNGDLTVFSTVYPDGTVAAMEELIGSHGGMGGEQTDAFLLHPGDMRVPATMNSADVFRILDARRNTPLPEEPAGGPTAREQGAWAPQNLAKGMAQVRAWLPLALRAIRLDPAAYREVAHARSMTGPALLISLLAAIVSSLARSGELNVNTAFEWFFSSLVAPLFIYGAGVLVREKRRGREQTATYTAVFRGVAFAHAALIFELLAFVSPLAPFARWLASGLTLIGSWLAAAVALDLRGWRGIVLPVVIFFVFVATFALTGILLEGAALSITSIGQQLGIIR